VRVGYGSKEVLVDHRASVRRGEVGGRPADPSSRALGRPGPWSHPSRLGVLPRPLVALVALAAVGVLAAGCGNGSGSGGYGSGGSGGTTSPVGSGPSGVATVAAASTRLGMVLVDGSGRTLYLFEKDQPNRSACAGACVAAWPVDQSSGTPKVGSGVKASLLGTIKRGDGATQVTYNQHPLYYYAGDSQPGQHNGQGVNAFGATWFVVAPAGAAVSGGATATTTAGNGYGSNGYGG
jgi:predicted lipoprotein with Yx(FWY)xxD motif